MEKTRKRRPYKTILPKSILPEETISGSSISPKDSILKQPISKEKIVVKQQPKRKSCSEPTVIEYRPEVHPLIAGYLRRDGANEVDIAEVIGIEVRELKRWCRIHPDFSQEIKKDKIASCEHVVRALFRSATGTTVTDVDRMYEVRLNPVTRKKERILVREKESTKTSLPNPLACFFYLQNRDYSRWSATGGGKDRGASFTPEQVSMMMRTSSKAISDFTLGEGLVENK